MVSHRRLSLPQIWERQDLCSRHLGIAAMPSTRGTIGHNRALELGSHGIARPTEHQEGRPSWGDAVTLATRYPTSRDGQRCEQRILLCNRRKARIGGGMTIVDEIQWRCRE